MSQLLFPPAVLTLFLFAWQSADAPAETAEAVESVEQAASSATLMDRIQPLASAVNSPNGRLLLATIVAGFGIWMMMPGSNRKAPKIIGAFLAAAGAILMFSLLPVLGLEFESVMFWLLTAITLSAGVATITSRSPVYCAIWFALVLLGVGGLFLVNGAQFVGIATVAVYAGAIVVTLLFVIMLAQPEGHSFYDRVSWGKIPSLLGCIAGVGLAALIVGAVAATPLAELASAAPQNNTQDVLVEDHVAALGGHLFTKHLINVELAATLLMAALVGAVAMAAHGSTRQDGLGGQEAQVNDLDELDAAKESRATEVAAAGGQS